MIPKPQLLSIATESGLLPTTVEKDYVLGWMLTGISRHPVFNQWSFKGGTCLKKCFFETYHFSEDLDFTVPDGGLYSREGIQNALIEMTVSLTDETGIQFPREGIKVKESINKRGRPTFVAKVTFIGPLNQPKSIQQRIKFDLTQDEIVVDGASHPKTATALPIRGQHFSPALESLEISRGPAHELFSRSRERSTEHRHRSPGRP
jgi:hypothetical protein